MLFNEFDIMEYREQLDYGASPEKVKGYEMTAKEFQERYNPQYDYIIGIDAGVCNGVISFSTTDNTFKNPETIDFWELEKHLSCLSSTCLVLIENPNLNKPTFKRAGQNYFQMQKISQNVGSNKRTAQLIIEYCKLNNIAFKEVRPTTKKWTAKEFQNRTGLKVRCSQHCRDAAKLIYEHLNKKEN